MLVYIGKQDLQPLFAYLAERYAKIEEVPNYADEPGFEKLVGVLERVQSDSYYPEVTDKTAYLLIQINKGHFFSNGNKRLALVAATVFLTLNGKQLRSLSKDEYKTVLSTLFPEYNDWTDYPEFSSTDFATYHLSIIVAQSGTFDIDHDVLKSRIKSFFEQAVE